MKIAFTFLALLAFVVTSAGCKPVAEQATPVANTGDTNSDEPIIMDEMPPMLDDVPGHPEHGPHGGDLVELGKEAFHAELVHGDGGIAMYILDGSATKQVAIASEKLVVSLKHDGQVAAFDLAAEPDDGESAGQSSRFTSTEPKLDQWLDAGADGAVAIQIEGKSYTGKISHNHDHAGHSH